MKGRTVGEAVAAILAAESGTLPSVVLAVPPTANNLFPTGKSGRRFPSRDYQAWRESQGPWVRRLARPTVFPVEVWLTLAGSGVNPCRDVANIEKACTDLLVSEGVLPGDSLRYVAGNHQVYRPDGGEPRVVVEIRATG